MNLPSIHIPQPAASLERWKEVPRTSGKYSVSNKGRIRGQSGSMLKPYSTGGKYLSVSLFGRHTKVHRIVAAAFLPNPEEKPFVNHKNFDPSDNRVENLEWCTHQENMHHYFDAFPEPRLGSDGCPIGFDRKFSDEQINQIRTRLKSGETGKSIANEFGVTKATISRIGTRKAYAHVR